LPLKASFTFRLKQSRNRGKFPTPADLGGRIDDGEAYAFDFEIDALALLGATAISAVSYAKEGSVPHGGFGGFDHVFFIIMENKTDTDILGNSYAPFINAYAKVANRATNYFAVGHPSAPNYLEIVGGSNFGLTTIIGPTGRTAAA